MQSKEDATNAIAALWASQSSVYNRLPQVAISRFLVGRIRSDGRAIPGADESAARLLFSTTKGAGPSRFVFGRVCDRSV